MNRGVFAIPGLPGLYKIYKVILEFSVIARQYAFTIQYMLN